MKIARAGVSRIADVTNDRSAGDEIFFLEIICAFLQMRVIINKPAVAAVLVITVIHILAVKKFSADENCPRRRFPNRRRNQ